MITPDAVGGDMGGARRSAAVPGPKLLGAAVLIALALPVFAEAQGEAPQAVEPELQVLYQGADGATERWSELVLRGQPLQVSVYLMNPTAMSASRAYEEALAAERERIVRETGRPPVEPIAVAAGHAPATRSMLLPQVGNYWLDNVRVELVRKAGDSGEVVEVGADRFRALMKDAFAEKDVLPRIIDLHGAMVGVSLPPAETATLPGGTYFLRFVYDSSGDVDDARGLVWHGMKEKLSTSFEVRDARSDSESVVLQYSCMQYFESMGDTSSALAAARKITAISRSYADYQIHLFIGGYEERLGHYDAAREAWNVYFEAVPQDEATRQVLMERVKNFPVPADQK